MADSLPVTLYRSPLGILRRQSDGRAILDWSPEAEFERGLNSRDASQHLRVGLSSADATESFFGALLPEGVALQRLSQKIKVDSSDLVAIFEQVGADLAGALSVGDGRAASDPELLEGDRLDQAVVEAEGYIIGGGGSMLPGFQRKLTLTRQDGRWYAGNGTVASTHILKPVLPDFRTSIESEHYTLSLARELGLTTFETWTEDIGGRAVLVVERYDRVRVGSDVDRIHQEDMAQALGLPWGGNSKFERSDPNANHRAMAAVLDFDRSVFDEGEPDRERLLRYLTLNLAVGNTDAHVKNYSILRPAGGRARLAPLYDAAPQSLGFDGSQSMSLFIAGASYAPDITRDHLVEEARTWGIREERARAIVDDTLTALIEATRKLPAHESIKAKVPGFIREQAKNLLAGEKLGIAGPVPPSVTVQIGMPLE